MQSGQCQHIRGSCACNASLGGQLERRKSSEFVLKLNIFENVHEANIPTTFKSGYKTKSPTGQNSRNNIFNAHNARGSDTFQMKATIISLETECEEIYYGLRLRPMGIEYGMVWRWKPVKQRKCGQIDSQHQF